MLHSHRDYESELQKLREQILLMGGLVERMLEGVGHLFVHYTETGALELINEDREVDRHEKMVDELAVQILVLRQPAAKDLRLVCAALKASKDIERMGDEIRNIAERLLELSAFKIGVSELSNESLITLWERVSKIIRRSLDCFNAQSSEQAAQLLELDFEVDQIYRGILVSTIERMKAKPEWIEPLMKINSIAKYLERVSDHAMNLAEQVVYVVEGLDIRHQDPITSTPQ